MIYTEKKYLTIVELNEDEENISILNLKRTLSKRPSNMIYCEIKGKLAGLISTGDILRAYRNGEDRVIVNKDFSFLYVGEYMKALKIFQENHSINALPVIEEDMTLIGDYTRWDDFAWLQNELSTGGGYKNICCFDGQRIAIVQSQSTFKEKVKITNILKEQLLTQDKEIQCVDYMEAIQCYEMFDLFLFTDEDEIRVFKVLFYIILGYDCDGQKKLKTHRSILDSDNYRKELYKFYLEYLREQQVDLLGLVLGESIYYQNLLEALSDKFALAGEEMWKGVIPKSTYKDFFDDLYCEEYIEQIIKIKEKGFENKRGILRLKDCKSKYYNVVDGERRTLRQPKEYVKSIYVVGPCYILGAYADDSRTIESHLQKCIYDAGYKIRVVNCGCWGMDFCNSLARIANIHLRKGDVIIIDQPPKNVTGMRYIDLNAVCEQYNVGIEWLNDWTLHCNHKVYKLYADAINEALEPIYEKEVENQGQLINMNDNYVKFLYLDRYFNEFKIYQYGEIGCIVMNCNPFTYGHRYLIEKALGMVDFLIIFVLEEDLSLFSFTQRFAMVREGISDLQNVMVVPSGPFILSRMSFPEYFIKETSKDIAEHTEQDIITFAEKIAPQLGIRYRFVGEEPEDNVTYQYNVAMKKILPKYNIALVEIPRKEHEGKYISASLVRKYMEENDMMRIIKLVPKTTGKILGISTADS